jgi:hypothetical protein
MVFEGLVGVGVAIIFALALAEYAKWRSKAERGWNWLAVAGVWFIFAGSFAVATTIGGYVGASVWSGISAIFEVLGWVFALIGTLLVAYEVLVEK